MSTGLIIILVIAALGAIIGITLYLDLPILGGERATVRGNLKNMVSAQRQSGDLGPQRGGRTSIFDSAKESQVDKVTDSRLTLRKRLKYAQWKMPILAFHALEIGISLFVFSLVSLKFNQLLQVISLISGPLFMRWLLNTRVEKRFNLFDADYPAFILSLVGLLKTGMNTMSAIEAAAKGLDQSSLVRQECELMIERLRFGVTEDKSIGSFGEDIFHPEIELFVQALLLSRRVGGTLSDTLDRLAKQVRKRQYFRKAAAAAVGMQRGSIWFIIAILASLEVYLAIVYPQAVFGAWKDEMGWQVWQFGIVVILLGIYWVRQVTKIKT